MSDPATTEDGMLIRVWCAPDVHIVRIAEDIVVLDVRADHYSCLVDAAALVKPRGDGSINVADSETARELVAAGVAVLHATPARAPFVAPSRDLVAAKPPSRILYLQAAVALSLAAVRFRGRPLTSLIEPVARRPASRPVPESRIAALVAAARSARAWVPFEGECLKRAFQLRCFLAEHGIAADWVFGVRTWPFAAHCWLQIGDLVVGDRVERVRLYAPILKV